MKLVELKINQMPGFQQGGPKFAKGRFCSGLNLIYGPNGSGKSTTASALKHLIWRMDHVPEPFSLSSVWEHEGEEFSLIANSVENRVMPSEAAKHLSTIPSQFFARCYHLSIDDLFHANDHHFSKWIEKEMSGGYDLEKVRSEPLFSLPKFHGRTEWKNVRLAEEKWQKIRFARAHLEKERGQLSNLKEEVRENQQKLDQLDALISCRERLQLVQEKNRLTHDLRKYPSSLQFLKGDEEERLAYFETEKQEISHKITQIKETMEKRVIQSDPFEELTFDALQQCVRDGRERDELRRESAKIDEEIDRLRLIILEKSRLIELSDTELGKLTLEKVHAQEIAYNKRDELEKRQLELKHRFESLHTTQSSEVDIEQLKRKKQKRELFFVKSGVAFTLISVMGLIHPAVSITLSAAYLGGMFWLSRADDPLVDDIAVARASRESADRVLRDEAEKRLQNVQEEIDQLDPSGKYSKESMTLYFEAIKQILEYQITLCQIEEKRNLLCVKESALLDKMDLYAAASIIDLERGIEHKRERELALKERDLEIKQLLELKKERSSLEGKLAIFLKAREVKSAEECRQLVSNWDEYKKAKDALFQLNSRIEWFDAKLKEYPDLLNLEKEELEIRIEALTAKKNQQQERIEKCARLEYQIEQLMQQDELENVSAEVKRAKEELSERYEEKLLEKAAQLFLNHVEKEEYESQKPEIVKEASNYLSLFTRGVLSLELNKQQDGSIAFCAYDHEKNCVKPLDELSTGSRIQLILAVRMAFVTMIEKRERGQQLSLPLILDETLSHTDMERFRAIGSALVDLVKMGRQLFYFTCQETDREAFITIARENGMERGQMAEIDLGNGEGKKSDLKAALENTLPKPGKMNLPEYAEKLGFSPYSGGLDIGLLDLSYLVENPSDLYTLRNLGIKSYGQLLGLENELKRSKQLSFIETVLTKGRLATLAVKMWKKGRSNPMQMEMVKGVGVKGKYHAPLCHLLESVKNDPKAWIERITSKKEESLKGMRQSTIDQILDKVESLELIDHREKLTSEQIKLELLQEDQNRAPSLYPFVDHLFNS